MASQEEEEEEAVPLVVAPGGVEPDEEVKKVESRGGEFSVNGAPLNHSFNSRISTDVDMAESQVAVAGSVDSAAEVSAVGAGVEEPSARVDHHAGSVSSGEVVDATEKVESWDLSEAVQEGAASKEDSKPTFSEDGTVEEIRSSDLIADAPTSAATVEDSAAADVEEKTGEGRSDEDVGDGREVVLPAEVVVTEDGSPKVQDEGSAEKGDSEAPEAPVEEVHKVGEATTSAEPEKEGASVEVVPSPSADVEEKAVDVEDNPAAVEDKPVDVEDKSVDIEDKSVDIEDKPVGFAEKSVEVKSEDAGLVSEELSAEDAASEEGSPKILDQGSTGKGDSESPESPVEEINEIAIATTAVEPDEAVASLEAVPSISADVEEKFVDVEDKSVDVEDKPVDVEDKPIDVADKSVDIRVQIVEMNSEDAGVVSEELPAVVAASEEVSPKDEGSAGKGNIEAPEAPVEEVEEVTESTPRAESHELGSLEALPSSPVHAEQNSVDLKSADAGAVSEDVSPIIRDEESTEKVDSKATDAPVEDEVHEVAEATRGAEPDEAGSNVEAVPSPSVDVEEKSVELDSADAGAVSEDVSPIIRDEEPTEKVDSEATEAPVEDEVHEVAEAISGAEPDEAGSNVEAVSSPSVDVEEKSFELDSADAGAVSEDVSPIIKDEEPTEKVDSEATEAPVEDEVHEVAEAISGAEPDEAGSNVEAVSSPSVDVEEKSFELDSADAGAVSEDVSPIIKDEEPTEKVDSDAPEPLVEEVHAVAEATSGAELDEAGSNVEAVPSPSVDVEEKSVELDSADAGAVSEDVSPKIKDEESAEKVDSDAPEPLVEEVHEVAEATSGAELDEAGSNVEAVPSPSVDVEEKSFELDSADAGAVSEDVSPIIKDEEPTEKVDSDAPEPLVEEVHEVAEATSGAEPDEAGSNVEAVPSPSVDVEEKSFELDSADAGAVSEDVSPIIRDEEPTEKVDSEATEAPVEDEVHEVAEAISGAEPDEAGSNVEAVSSPSVDVEEKSFELDSADAGAVSEDVSPIIRDEEPTEKVDGEAPDAPVEDEVHEVAEATSGAELDEAGSNVEAVPSPSVDVEEKSVELDSADAGAVSEDVSPIIRDEEPTEKVDSEATEAPVEDEVHEVAEATSGAEPDEAGSNVEAVSSPSVDVEEKSFELDSADAGAVSEDVSPIIKDEEPTEKVDSDAPEPLVEEVHEVAEATSGAEPDEAGSNVEAVPSPSVDVEEKSFELDSADAGAVSEDVSPIIKDEEPTEKVDSDAPEPLVEEVHEVAEATSGAEPDEAGSNVEAVPSPSVDVEEKSFELDSADAGAVSEDVSPIIKDEEPTEKVDSDAPEPLVEEVHEVAEATSGAELDEAGSNVEAVPSPSVDVEEKSFELDSADAGAVSEDVSPIIKDEEPTEKVDSDAPEPLVEEVHEVAEATSGAELDEAGSNVEAVPSPSVDVEEKSFELNSEDAMAVRKYVSPQIEDEESAEKVDGEAPEGSVEEVCEVAEPTTSAEPAEEVASVEAVPSSSVDVEEISVEMHSADAGAVSEDVSPKIEDEEKVDSEAPDAPVEDEVHEVADTTTTAEPDEAGANLEAVPSSSVDVEEISVELDSADAGAVSEDVSPKIDAEESAEKFDSNAPEPLVEEVLEVTTDTEPDGAGSNVEAVPTPSVDVEEKSFELDSADAGAVDEDVSPKIEDEESAEKVDSEAPEPLVEEVHEVAEATTGADPSEEVASSIAVPSSSVDVEEKPFELDSAGAGTVTEDVRPKMEDEESAEKVDIESPETPVEDDVHEVAEATTSAEPDEAGSNVEAVPSPSVDVEEKSVELDSAGAGTVSEDVSPTMEDEESADNGDREAREVPLEEQVHEVAEARTSTEPDEANVEAVPSPSVDVEEKSFDLDSVDAGAVSEGVSPEIEAEGSAEKVDREASEVPVEDAVHEVAEATSRAKPDEAVSSLEAVSVPSVDLEDKSFELNSEDAVAVSEDVSPIIKDEESIEKVDSEAPEPLVEDEVHEVAEAINGAEPAEEVSSSFSVPSPSVDVEEKSFELDHVDPTTIAEAHEETASQESVSAPAEDVEDKSVQEVDSKDTSEASEVLPPESTTDKEDVSPDPLAEGIVGSETLFFPDEEVHEVVEETISAEPGEVPVEPESALAPSDVEDRSVDVNSGDAIGVTTTSESVDKEGVSPETSSEATISAGADASLESEGSASLDSVSSPANYVEDRSLGVNPEDTSEAKIELDTENANKDDLSPELPAEGSADNVGSESLFTSVEEVHEVIEETISPELDEGSTSLESGPASDDVEEKLEDLSEATTTVQPLESVDKELDSRDLPVEELHAPIEEIGKFEDAATDEESTVLESAAASSEDVQSMPETKSRESNLNDLKETLTTSEKEESAIGEEGSPSDAAARDTTPLDVSSPPPADEKKESPNSYDLHEEAVHLEEAAEKTLEDVKSGDKHASVAESVAQIVLDESSKTEDSSELISGVIQHVAQLAQDDFQSDPNVLPDTVNQVFDRESAGSPANEGSQPKESSSLGTKFSLFVIWCISLCASHVSSKDMPAPALKLGAEEVAAVLHSNAQGAASSKAASSV